MVSSIAVKETQFREELRALVERENDPRIGALRERAFKHFAAEGFPTSKDEDWKYTNVTPVVNGEWSVSETVNGQQLSEIDIEILSQFALGRNGFTALNLAFADVRVVRIAKETSLDKPIEFTFEGENGKTTFPHVIVMAEAGSKATIVETYASNAKSFINAAVQVIVEDNASITHYRVQKDSPEAFNYGVTEVTLGRGSSYDSTNINLGGGLSRHDIEVKFTAEGGEAWVDGLYMLNGSQHHDTHSIIDHTVPNCISHQNYRGVLNDKSRAVFNGKVFVRENASGTDAQQQNKNLLLSNDARVDTKPQLEIFNDDVKWSGSLRKKNCFTC